MNRCSLYKPPLQKEDFFKTKGGKYFLMPWIDQKIPLNWELPSNKGCWLSKTFNLTIESKFFLMPWIDQKVPLNWEFPSNFGRWSKTFKTVESEAV